CPRGRLEEGTMQVGLTMMSGSRLGAEVASRAGAVVDHGPAPGSAAAGRPARGIPRGELVARILLPLAAAALLISPAYPYWNMKLAGPQYPRGLSLAIYPDHVAGDVGEIDGLNHYIGMRKIGDAAAMERRVGMPMVVLIAACLVIAAPWRSRWAVLLVIP